MNLPSPQKRTSLRPLFAGPLEFVSKPYLDDDDGKIVEYEPNELLQSSLPNNAKLKPPYSSFGGGRLPWTCLCSAICFLLGRYLPAAPHQQRSIFTRQEISPPTCGGGGVGDAEYNTPLHVGALFIILFVSSSACAFPILALRVPKLRIPRNTIFAIRHFGTGVLIATAFVHLLPTAFVNLGNPCLGQFWTQDYPAMPGAIALASILVLIVIEMVFSPARLLAKDVVAVPSNERSARPTETSIRMYSGRATSLARQPSSAADDSQPVIVPTKGLELTPEQERKKQLTQCVLLECSILFHSVFIGLALSVALGSDFIVLLIAIVFHQTFEGLALGARIAAVGWPAENRVQPWLMALAYGCTTPLGQAIGLATHTLYDPDSRVGLLVVGVFNAISSGLLAYASLVELLAEDFLSDHSWQELRGRRRVVGFTLVIFGCVGMSVVGAFA